MADDRELASELTDEVQPFTMIQNAFLDDATLSAVAFRVFIILKSYTSGRAKTKLAFPSYSTLKTRCNISGNTTLAKAIRELEAAGWIKRDKRFGRSSLYTIRAITPKTGIVAITPEIGAQSARNWPNSPPKTGIYQEVPKQEVPKQEVERPRRKTAGFASVMTSHPDARVSSFLEILARPHVTDTDAALILSKISRDECATWRDVLTIWAANPNWRIDLAGMFDRYQRTVNAKRYQTPTAANGNGKHAMPDIVDGAREILRQRAAARGETI